MEKKRKTRFKPSILVYNTCYNDDGELWDDHPETKNIFKMLDYFVEKDLGIFGVIRNYQDDWMMHYSITSTMDYTMKRRAEGERNTPDEFIVANNVAFKGEMIPRFHHYETADIVLVGSNRDLGIIETVSALREATVNVYTSDDMIFDPDNKAPGKFKEMYNVELDQDYFFKNNSNHFQNHEDLIQRLEEVYDI